MSKSLPPLWLTQIFDNNGELLAGGQVYTYAAGTTTPLATYSNGVGAANTNPVVLDSAGRANIFLTADTAYKFVVKDADGNTLLTVDDIVSASGSAAASTDYEIAMSYVGTPGAQAIMAAHQVIRTATLPVNFDGADASVGTNPASTYTVSVKLNDVTVGTCTFNTSGVPTLTTTGGSTVPLAFGDRLTFVAPDSGTAADFAITLVGAL